MSLLERASWEVAPALLGWHLSHSTREGVVTVRLTELEAYEGDGDPASHAHRGETKRNAVMFGEAGRLYVYRVYGLHWASNIVTDQAGTASAVLLRAGEVVDGHGLARVRRGPVADRSLARGPGCLAQALGLTGEHTGMDVLGEGALTLVPGGPVGEVAIGPRVGVSKAHDVPWRFWLAGDPTVSAYKLSPRAPTLAP